MRISVYENDPDYVPALGMYTVLLNGEPLVGCFEADEGAGMAWVHRDSAPDVLLYGVVRIVRNPVGGVAAPLSRDESVTCRQRRVQVSWRRRWCGQMVRPA